MTALTFVALNATYPARAQQSPATAPTTGVVVPARPAVTYQAPVQYVYPTQYTYQYQYQYQQQPAQAAAPAAPAAAPAAAAGGDAYGFTAWLNGVRAQYGLPAVGYDANLEAWASQNNAQQQYRGIGHFVMGPARRQNSAMGGFAQIGSMWLSSPAHRAALLDPTIRFIGIAGAGAYWTFNAY